jgi:phosphoserine phosphatase RsbU/P
MRILIADDDFISRNMLAAILRKVGHDVLETASGTEAWVELQKPDAPKLVVLDWVMPGMDGLEVVKKVRTLKGDQPPHVIMLTTKGDKSDIVAALEAGADDYLSKPFDAGELLARIAVGRRLLETREALFESAAEVRRALAEVKTLRGIVPICAGCKKIRDDSGFWQQVECYVRDHSEAEFSHGLCPECIKTYYPDEDLLGEDAETPS